MATDPIMTAAAAPSARPRSALRLTPTAAGRCRRRVHLDHAPDAARTARSEPDDGLKMRLADMDAHAVQVLEVLPAFSGGWTPDDATRPTIVRSPVLRTATRFGIPDLLFWDGDGYLPVLIRGHRTLDPGSGARVSPVGDPLRTVVDPGRRARRHPGDELQLAHHRAMLRELGLAASSSRGGVIGRGSPFQVGALAAELAAAGVRGIDDGAVVLWHDLDTVEVDYQHRFDDRYAVAAAARAGGELARPSKVAECRRCPWWPVCEPELEAAHDVSLLAAGADVEALHAAGLRTLDDLIAAPAEVLADLKLTAVRVDELRVKARARLEGRPLVRRQRSGEARRADVELDVDMESYLDQGAYLWGALLQGRDIGIEQGYRGFVQWDELPDGGAAAFAEFWAFLMLVRAACAERGLSFAAYCWSRTAEERWMYAVPALFGDRPGVPSTDEVRAFCTSAQWIDLFAEVKRIFVVPGSMRLKAIAPVAGFRWRDEAPGGENSMAWFRGALGLDETDGQVDEALRSSLQQRILAYNEDDVLATAAIRRWMSGPGLELPTVSDLLDQAPPH
ncbi:MAG: TM0106 family RecB-like putative nuclease [Nakamurella sp.]